MGIRSHFQRFDQQKSLLSGKDITARLLPEFAGVAITIEVIVLYLESQAQVFAELVDLILIAETGAAKDSADLQAGGKQDRGL